MSKINNLLNPEKEDLHLLHNNYIIDIPKDVIFPSELTEFLKQKVEYLMHENGMLKRSIAENDSERETLQDKIQKLELKVSKYEDTSEFAPIANVARSKIIELSKKLRERNAELETFRNKCFNLEQHVNLVQNNVEIQYKTDEFNSKGVNDHSDTSKLLEEVATLKEKCVGINSKLFEARNANLMLKNDLNFANKLLQEEIGESFENLQQIRTGNWKGRAQTISELQHKNMNLKDKLKSYQEKVVNGGDLSAKKSVLERKLDKITREYDALKLEYEETKKKFESLKLRFKNLEIECSNHKNKFACLSNEAKREQELFAHLSLKNSESVTSHNEQLKKMDSVINSLKAQLKKSNFDLIQEKCNLERLEKESIEKSEEIKKLKSNKSITNIKTSDDKTFHLHEADKLHLTELTAVANQRLFSERDARANIENLLRQEKQKVVKLEAKINRLQLHESAEKSSSYTSISISRNTHKDELLEDKLVLAEENIKALKTRLEIEKLEKEHDLQEFVRIFKNHNCIKSSCSSSSSLN